MNDFIKFLLILLIIFSILGLFVGSTGVLTYSHLVEVLSDISVDSNIIAASVIYFSILEDIFSNFNPHLPQGVYADYLTLSSEYVIYLNTTDNTDLDDPHTTTLFLWRTTDPELFSYVVAFFRSADNTTGTLLLHPAIPMPPSFDNANIFTYIQAVFSYVIGLVVNLLFNWDFLWYIISGVASAFGALLQFPFDLIVVFFRLVFI